jgi:molybdenum cofactor guanylyltransferase
MHQGLPLIEHALACLAAQTSIPTRVLISANRNIDAYKQTGHAVVTDERENFAGPLAGIEAGLMRCKKNNLLVIPCDTPQLPPDLFERLEQALAENPSTLAAYAVTNDGPQPLCCLLRPSAAGWLAKYLDEQQAAAIKWLDQLGACAVHFEDAAAFSNFNTMEMFQSLKPKGQA